MTEEEIKNSIEKSRLRRAEVATQRPKRETFDPEIKYLYLQDPDHPYRMVTIGYQWLRNQLFRVSLTVNAAPKIHFSLTRKMSVDNYPIDMSPVAGTGDMPTHYGAKLALKEKFQSQEFLTVIYTREEQKDLEKALLLQFASHRHRHVRRIVRKHLGYALVLPKKMRTKLWIEGVDEVTSNAHAQLKLKNQTKKELEAFSDMLDEAGDDE